MTVAGADPETLASALGIRSAILRFVQLRQTIVREWHDERLCAPTDRLSDQQRPGKRRRTALSANVQTDDLVSLAHLQSLDSSLAPYPFQQLKTWATLTQLIDRTTVARVIGFDARGDAHVDAIMSALGEADEHTTGSGAQRVWGKARPNQEIVTATEAAVDELENDAMLRFATFDLKRSWPPGAIGEELTRNSRDKSWLLQHVIKTQFEGGMLVSIFLHSCAVLCCMQLTLWGRADPQQILAEMALAYILFTSVHNFSSLEAYKRLLSLLCRSTSALSSRLPLIHTLLSSLLRPQFEALPDNFFADELPVLETFFIAELAALRIGLRATTGAPAQLETVWTELGRTVEKFGWNLGTLKPMPETPEHLKPGKTHYDLLRADGESEDEDDEDRPVVVGIGAADDEVLDVTLQDDAGARRAILRRQLGFDLDNETDDDVIRL